MPGFQIRYPENPLYEAWINASPSMLCGHDQSGLADALDAMNEDMEPIYEVSDSSGVCSCHNFEQYLEDNNLTSSSDADIAAFINSDPTTGVTTADATAVGLWRTSCANSLTNEDLSDIGFPQAWMCLDFGDLTDADDYNQATCTCENIHNVINMLGYDPADAGSYDAITAGLNGYLAPTTPITLIDWLGWLAECETADPSIADLETYHLPEILKCPEPVSESDDDIHTAQETAACMQGNLITALANSIMLFHQQLENETDPA